MQVQQRRVFKEEEKSQCADQRESGEERPWWPGKGAGAGS